MRFLINLWRNFADSSWSPNSVDRTWRRWNNGQWEHRPMTQEEFDHQEWMQAIK